MELDKRIVKFQSDHFAAHVSEDQLELFLADFPPNFLYDQICQRSLLKKDRALLIDVFHIILDSGPQILTDSRLVDVIISSISSQNGELFPIVDSYFELLCNNNLVKEFWISCGDRKEEFERELMLFFRFKSSTNRISSIRSFLSQSCRFNPFILDSINSLLDYSVDHFGNDLPFSIADVTEVTIDILMSNQSSEESNLLRQRGLYSKLEFFLHSDDRLLICVLYEQLDHWMSNPCEMDVDWILTKVMPKVNEHVSIRTYTSYCLDLMCAVLLYLLMNPSVSANYPSVIQELENRMFMHIGQYSQHNPHIFGLVNMLFRKYPLYIQNTLLQEMMRTIAKSIFERDMDSIMCLSIVSNYFATVFNHFSSESNVYLEPIVSILTLHPQQLLGFISTILIEGNDISTSVLYEFLYNISVGKCSQSIRLLKHIFCSTSSEKIATYNCIPGTQAGKFKRKLVEQISTDIQLQETLGARLCSILLSSNTSRNTTPQNQDNTPSYKMETHTFV